MRLVGPVEKPRLTLRSCVCVRECVCERVPAHVFSGMAVGQTAAQYGFDFVAHSSDILVLNTCYCEQRHAHRNADVQM